MTAGCLFLSIFRTDSEALTCRLIVRHQRSARIRSPTTPTRTHSSRPTTPGTVTLIANYLPFEAPFGGPNFFEFADDVSYDIYVDNDGDGEPNITYEFDFQTVVGNPNTFLYNTGPIDSISSPNWNRKQFYSVTRTSRWGSQVLASDLACPPCNIGPASTPNYAGARR